MKYEEHVKALLDMLDRRKIKMVRQPNWESEPFLVPGSDRKWAADYRNVIHDQNGIDENVTTETHEAPDFRYYPVEKDLVWYWALDPAKWDHEKCRKCGIVGTVKSGSLKRGWNGDAFCSYSCERSVVSSVIIGQCGGRGLVEGWLPYDVEIEIRYRHESKG